MGGQELIESLRKTADEQVRAIWRDAEEEAEKLRSDAAHRKEELARLAEGRPSAEAAAYERSAMREASRKARTIGLGAEAALSERLYALSRASLPSLRQERGGSLIPELAAELPSLEWKTVRVNAADLDQARKAFLSSDIVPDEQVSGGLEAVSGDGTIRINNTFEIRLERAWPGLIPEMVKDVLGQTRNSKSPLDP